MKKSTAEVEAYLHNHIPITTHLGVAVVSYDGSTLCLQAPLDPNLNHRQTAFGGSVSSVAILSGWSLVHMRLLERDIEARLVIQKSNLDFLRAVEEDFRATGSAPKPEAWDRFFNLLSKRGLGRIDIESEVTAGGLVVGRHTGRYVAITED